MKVKNGLFSISLRIMYVSLFSFLCLNVALSQQFDGGDINNIRGNWFLRDRAFPYDTIPSNSMAEAMQYKQEMTDNYGYYLGSYNSWVSLGPRPYYTYGTPKPFAGRIQSVKYMPYISGQHDPNVLYIAGHNGGIWKTTNLQVSNSELNVVFNPITDFL